MGVTYPTISRWQNGRTTPSPLAIEKLQSLLQQMDERAKDLSAKYLLLRRATSRLYLYKYHQKFRYDK
ncbi:MAG: helix-turn-helix domain-containing protein [Fischerella sp.]|nr:helix-turn-helix domain-containing protein [Fischerella sp.]